MTPAPVVVLAAPHSQAAFVAALIGGHPRAYALPELRLFACERLDQLLSLSEHGDARGNDGLLRAVAELFCGGQRRADIDAARRQLERRRDWSTAAVLDWIVARVAPRTAVFHDICAPLHIVELDRWRAAAPDAAYLHLLRHPAPFSDAARRIMCGRAYVPPDYSDHAGPPRIAPELLWFRVHDTLEREFAQAAPGRCRRLRVEDLHRGLADELALVCRWLGWADDDAALHAMQHTADTPFAGPGPANAPSGAEADFLSAPQFASPRGVRTNRTSRPAALSEAVLAKARRFGYV